MNRSLISYDTILAAKNGDSDDMQQILRHYGPYIASFSKRTFLDEYGNRYEFVDEYIRQRIEAKLMQSIMYIFYPYKQPCAINGKDMV